MKNSSSRAPFPVAALAAALAIAALPALLQAGDAALSREAEDLFENRVRPLLIESCIRCHGERRQQAGLRLDGREHILKGSDGGPVLVAGKPEESLLVRAIRYEDEPKMPPKGKLPPEAIEAVAAWVRLGAPWPEPAGAGRGEEPTPEGRDHWAFQPLRDPPLPPAVDPSWICTPLDRFVLAKLAEHGLTPSPPAGRQALIRRVTFDLTGLPPAPEEVAAFEADGSAEAFARVVDRLLASPRYGERWGRHWLDVARYADSKGYVFTEERRYPYAYTYRDWVIRAFNEDLPYDRFIVQQIAADHLPLGEDKAPLAAMGFLTLGRRFLNNAHDIIDDRIDVVTRGFLGLTVQCARCHDHKYDPIPTEDYYSLYGVFASSVEPKELPLIGRPEDSEAYRAFQTELEARERKVNDAFARHHAALVSELRARSGDYLIAIAEGKGDGEGEAGLSLGPGELRPQAVRRWKAFLEETRKAPHPVFAPWHALLEARPEEVAAKSQELAAAWQMLQGGTPPVNRRVVEALSARPPASLREAAERYGELLATAECAWQELLEAHRKAAASGGGEKPPAALEDPALEELRQVLYAPNAPANVPAAEAERLLDRAARNEVRELRQRVDELKATSPAAPARAMALADLPAPVEPKVFVRGNPRNPGPQVPRRFLKVLAGEERQPFREGSGRLELARAIASAENPLTARVIANRVWLHHFGAGLVRTPSDFGLRSDPPAHPELLDWLASRLLESGWSLKALHRLILLSSTYRQASDDRPECRRLDPDNRLLWRMDRRRLELEALRDSLLAVSGRLDFAAGGPAVDIIKPLFTPRRTVYGFIDRQNLPGLFRTFDFASPDATSPQRHVTTVPQQALFLMNSPFVLEAARRLAAREEVASLPGAAQRIERLYRLCFGRAPEPEELDLAFRFLEKEVPAEADSALSRWEAYSQALLLSNEFAFVD
jgi:mono/diheme cytochrome c family protein